MKLKLLTITGCTILLTTPMQAMNYHELEVYGHQTEGQGIIEIENISSFSNGDKTSFGSEIFRNTLEVNYGLTDSIDLAVYGDFVSYKDGDGEAQKKYAGTRFRLHGRILEKGELPIDFGYYIEVGIPKNSDAIYEIEFKPIIEYDISAFTLQLNPTIEYEVEEEEEVEENGEVKTEIERKFEYAYAASIAFRAHSHVTTAIDVFGNFEEEEDEKILLIVPNVDFSIGKGWSANVGLGFGATEATEKRLVNLALEYEF